MENQSNDSDQQGTPRTAAAAANSLTRLTCTLIDHGYHLPWFLLRAAVFSPAQLVETQGERHHLQEAAVMSYHCLQGSGNGLPGSQRRTVHPRPRGVYARTCQSHAPPSATWMRNTGGPGCGLGCGLRCISCQSPDTLSPSRTLLSGGNCS